MTQLFEGRKKRLGDRKDGFKVRNLDPMTRLTGYIMKDKVDAWVLFEDDLDITHTQNFLRQYKKEIPGLSLYHILFAALVRTISQTPQINRFCCHNNVYARNEIKIAMVIKKGMKQDSDRTVITPKFFPDDTLKDVMERIETEVQKIDRSVEKVEEDGNRTDFDKLEVALSLIPDFVLRFVVWLLKVLDRHGWLPKVLTDLSPFHASLFITNMGSFGMDSVYHHIYEFGTVSGFGGMGMKKIRYEEKRDGNKMRKVYIPFKFVVDERICDGYIYGQAFKQIKDYMAHPEQLLTPPKQVVADNIDRKRK